MSARLLSSVVLIVACLASNAKAQQKQKDWPVERICNLISANAAAFGVPRDFFARLIWTESRFDINARSPVGAQGIAQFMPATAKERGLKNPYDPAQAIPASASLLKLNKQELGNWVLAAAAYNAGPYRVSRWMRGKSFMPFETQNYIVSIFGVRIERFKNRDAVPRIPKLDEKRGFDEACRRLPVVKTRAKRLDDTLAGRRLPWGVQVAANFSKRRAISSWLRIRGRLGLVVGGFEPNVHRVRTPKGMKSKWAVRLGETSRNRANRLCARIKKANGFCIVLKNKS